MRIAALLLSTSVAAAPLSGAEAERGAASASVSAEAPEPASPSPSVEELPLDRDEGPLPFAAGAGGIEGPGEAPASMGAVGEAYQPLLHSPEARAARRWVNAGIGAAATGGLLVGSALAMGLQDPCAAGWGNNCFKDARDRAALSMGIPGGVLLLGGAAMITVGGVMRRRLWLGERSLSLVPVVGRGDAGLVLRGRF